MYVCAVFHVCVWGWWHFVQGSRHTLIRADRGIGKQHLMDRVQGQTSPCGPLILPLIAPDLLPPDWLLKHTLTQHFSHWMYQHQVSVCEWKRESLDTKLCFQLNNSAPFQQYQGPRGREQKRKQVEGRRKEWRELVALWTAEIILALLSAECSCHTSMGTELKDESSLLSFSLFLCFLQIYTFLYLLYFLAFLFASSSKTRHPNHFLNWSILTHALFPRKNYVREGPVLTTINRFAPSKCPGKNVWYEKWGRHIISLIRLAHEN